MKKSGTFKPMLRFVFVNPNSDAEFLQLLKIVVIERLKHTASQNGRIQ